MVLAEKKRALLFVPFVLVLWSAAVFVFYGPGYLTYADAPMKSDVVVPVIFMEWNQ